MKDYANSFMAISDIRKADRNERLTKLEMKEYRKFTGKLSWLAAGTQPDLSYTVLKMLQKNISATIAYLHNCNKVLKKVRGQRSEYFYRRVRQGRS